jgi:hypothetical protein
MSPSKGFINRRREAKFDDMSMHPINITNYSEYI